MICHDVIGRRKMAIDNIINGLKTLGFHTVMKRNPDKFKKFFERSSLSQKEVLENVR